MVQGFVGKRPFRLLPVVLLLALMTGCTASFSYRFADWLLMWWVESYITLDSEQKKALKSEIQQVVDWHQREELPRYQQWLGDFRSLSSQPLSSESGMQALESWAAEIDGFWNRIALKTEPIALNLLSSLNDSQVEELLENLEQEQEELSKEYGFLNKDETVRLEKRQKLKRKRTEKFARRWVGRLNSEQKQLIGDWAVESQDMVDMWLQQRELWKQKLAEALGKRETESLSFAEEISVLFTDSSSLWPPQYQSAVEKNTQLSFELIAAMQGTLTEKQGRKLNKEISHWEKVLGRLSAEND